MFPHVFRAAVADAYIFPNGNAFLFIHLKSSLEKGALRQIPMHDTLCRRYGCILAPFHQALTQIWWCPVKPGLTWVNQVHVRPDAFYGLA